jgi:hypothetical protein
MYNEMEQYDIYPNQLRTTLRYSIVRETQRDSEQSEGRSRKIHTEGFKKNELFFSSNKSVS